MSDAFNVKVGPGKLYIAELGTDEPVDLTTVWDAEWIAAGWTDEGHTFTQSPSVDPIEVAELKSPVKYYTGSIEYSLEFALAEITARNLQIALNGGTITTGTGIKTFQPPAGNAEAVRIMIGWESDSADERWVFRKCFQSGDSAIARQKGPAKATIPMTFNLEIPSGVTLPWKGIIKDLPA